MGKNHLSTLHLNVAFDVETKQFVDAVVQEGIKENECSVACELVDGLSEKYPVIIMADRGYESYNLFAHIEEQLFDYVIRIKDVESNGMLSGMDLPDAETFDITRRIVITRHSTGPATVNPKKYKYLTKQSRFDFIENSKCPDYEMTIRFVRFKITLKDKEKDLKHHLQVNFTQAIKICLHFFRFRGLEPTYDIEATIRRFLLPVRPSRQRQRIVVSTTVVSIKYRLA